jgi:ABC-2 type transport system permease protein
MPINNFERATRLAALLMKEQLKETAALFWIIISPSLIFYLMAYSKKDILYFTQEYLDASSWFYSYIASNVAFFGFCFYIIGRRESGFIRSFVYSQNSKYIFLTSQFLAYSAIAMVYCAVFYLFTRLPFGDYELLEFCWILTRFYFCYMLFCIPGLLFTLCPMNFQSANTVLSICSFGMLALGIISTSLQNPAINIANYFNPLVFANCLMLSEQCQSITAKIKIITIFIVVFFVTVKYFRINPIWSRY